MSYTLKCKIATVRVQQHNYTYIINCTVFTFLTHCGVSNLVKQCPCLARMADDTRK